MKSYQYLFFDLDGTLTDPGLGITNSVAHALKKYGIEETDRKQLDRFVGPPLVGAFQDFYGFSEEESLKAVDYFREYFTDKGIFENFVYEGIADVLKALKEAGKTLIVATSKPEEFARIILDHFSLSSYFTYIAGSNMDETRSRKSEVIAYAMESCGITDVSHAIMIGDREHDIIGGKEMNMDTAGVLYGYGSLSELQGANADHICKTVEDLLMFTK